jgi:hypothetical protein
MLDEAWVTAAGLRSGQMRAGPDKLTHNSGWYTAEGKKLGWGDLSQRDIAAILTTLPPGEAFIILNEQDSFWQFVTRLGPVGDLCTTAPDAENPGQEYVLEHAMLGVKDGRFIYVLDFNPAAKAWVEKNKIGNVLPETMTESEFAEFIQATTTGAHNA